MASDVLNTAYLPRKTRSVLEQISTLSGFSRFTLVGGSALAMRIGHRSSEDLDFIWDAEKLSARIVDKAVEALSKRHKVTSLTSPAEMRRAREQEGIELSDYRRKYLADGVKLELFSHHKPEIRRYMASADTDLYGSTRILSLEGLFVTKSVVIGERRRSRDLFDLMVLIRDHGYSVDRLFDAVSKYDPIADAATHKAVLIGTVGIDKEDEGLAPMGVKVTMDEIHSFFREHVADYEARLVAASVRAWRAEDSVDSEPKS